MRVLIIGAGAIGGTLARALDTMPDVLSVLVYDRIPDNVTALVDGLKKARPVASFEEGLHASDVAVEAASQEAVAQYGPHVLAAGRDLVVLSAGALANDAFRDALEAEARRTNRRVYVPSGALAGLDGVKGAREGRLESVTLTTAKPPSSLPPDVPRDLNGPVTLYEGPAREAVREFPKNVNVAAALSLAGIGLDETRVRVVADPSLRLNVHTVEVRGDFGEFTVTVRNRPSPANPATSHLASLAAIALLRRLASPIQVGT